MTDRIYGLTDTGKDRSNNEDTFIAQPTADGKYIIACVIDGVGGYSGGEVAAALTHDLILMQLAQPKGDLLAALIHCFHLANKKIIEQKTKVKEHESMACVATLALIDVTHNEFYYVHVGDTRLYLLRDHSLIKITHDQSFVGYLEESGRISEQEAMTHPKRNEINKALGFDADMAENSEYIETGRSPFLPGDRLLLCSDGLTDMVGASDINRVLVGTGSLQAQCQKLIEMANDKGGLDNITVVLAANDKEPAKYDATRPTATQKLKKTSSNEPVIQRQPSHSVEKDQEAKSSSSNSWLIVTLGIFTLAFLAGNVWQYLHNKQTATVVAEAAPTIDTLVSSPLQVKLEDALANLTGNLLLLSDSVFTEPIKITRPIVINRDTLFIKTKGKLTLVADSGYQGVAFHLSTQCKLVMLDSMVIKNFKTGLVTYNNALLLKKVQFEDCEVSIQNLLTSTNHTRLSGAVQALQTDSTPVKH